MFPLMASSISLSVGLAFCASSTAALIICPLWQYPHCGTSTSIHARCSGCDRLADNPSIVVRRFPATLASGDTHERIALPSRCTVHAPHNAIPHPNLVPVNPSESRSTHSSGVDGSSSTFTGFPLSVNEITFGLPESRTLVPPATMGQAWKRVPIARRSPMLPSVLPLRCAGPPQRHTKKLSPAIFSLENFGMHAGSRPLLAAWGSPRFLFPKKPGLGTLLCKRHLLWPVCNATNGSRHLSVDSAIWGGKPCVWLSATLPPRHFAIFLPRFWRDTMHRSGCRRGCAPGTHAEGKSAEKNQARLHRPGFEARADSYAGRSRTSRSKEESAGSSGIAETARGHGRPIASCQRASRRCRSSLPQTETAAEGSAVRGVPSSFRRRADARLPQASGAAAAPASFQRCPAATRSFPAASEAVAL